MYALNISGRILWETFESPLERNKRMDQTHLKADQLLKKLAVGYYEKQKVQREKKNGYAGLPEKRRAKQRNEVVSSALIRFSIPVLYDNFMKGKNC